MNHNKNKQSVIALSIAFVVILGLCMPISAQPPSPPEPVVITEAIRLSVDPANITADGISTSTITANVVWPEGWDVLSGTPACLVNVSFYTTLGNITAYNITLPTPDNQSCIAIATLTAGTEPGTATITAMADIAPPDVTALVRNTTTVVLEAPGETPTPTAPPSGGVGGDGGDSGIPPTPPAGTPSHIALNATPSNIPADGSSTSTITASVWDGNRWVLENLTVNFNTSLGNITTSASIVNGTATAVLTTGTEEGIATVTAKANLPEVGIITNTIMVNFTTPGATPTPPVTVTPTPTVTISPTPTATPSPSPTPKPGIPGFEAVFAIAGLLAVAYLVLRKRR